MEQRTRILHHTRSKTPVILAPSKPWPRAPTQATKLAKSHEKAPLASLDTDVPNSSRRQTKSRDRHGSRSSSTGRHEPGSSRLVSRDFLKSDQISDRSGDDEDPTSPCRSAPLRRHTMGSITRPRTRSQDAPEPTSASRVSCPPEARASSSGNHFPKDMKWTTARQDIPSGPVVKLPAKNPMKVGESATQSKYSHLNRTSSKVSDHSEFISNTTIPCKAVSPTVFSNSDSHQPHGSQNSKGHSKKDLTLHVQERAIPTTLSSQLANRDSINLSSPVTSPVYSFSVSSPQSSKALPPSSLNIRTSNLQSSSAVTSPSSSSERNCTSPQITSGYSWRTDPRRKPFQANGEFCLSPGDESHHSRSPQHTEMHLQHAFATKSSPSTGMETIQISPSMYNDMHPSSNTGLSSTLHIAHNKSNSIHDKTPGSAHISDQQQGSDFNNHPSKHFVNNKSATMPFSSAHRGAKQSFSDRKNNGSIRDNSIETIQYPQCSSSNTSFESCNTSHIGNSTHTTFDVRSHHPARSQPTRQMSSSSSSSSHYEETAHIQTKSNHNHTFPGHDHKDKINMQGIDYLNRKNGPITTHIKEYNQIVFHYSSQLSQTATQSRYSEDICVDSLSSSGSCRKRDSMRIATEGFEEMSCFSQSIDYANLPGSRNTSKQEKGSRREITVEHGHTRSLPVRDDRQGTGSERLQVDKVQNNVDREESLPNDKLAGHFVRRCRQRDSYRLATSSNPDLLSSADQEEELYVSCEDILASDGNEVSGKSSTSINSKNVISTTLPFQTLHGGKEPVSENAAVPSDTNVKSSSINSELFSKIKRNSLRLATASLSDLSVILDEIDIGEAPETPTSDLYTIEHPSPIFMRNSTNLSPLAERSLERSGSSVSSRNSSSFGSFYSCQSIGRGSAKNSPNHASSHSSPRDSIPKVSTPDSVHKLLSTNGHDSGISQSSEDGNSYNTFANTSIGSSEEMEYGMNHLALGGSLNRKRPVFYWTRQSPYPRQNHNTIPASWKPREYSPPKSSIHSSPRYPKSGSIRSYGSTSSVESSSNKTKPTKPLPRSSQILQRYGCGLDKKSPRLCTRGSTDSLTHKATHPKTQSTSRGGISSGNRENCTLPLPSRHNYRSNMDSDRYGQPQGHVSPTFIESPTADTPRSPPSLGRPKRKLYAGFDSQPLPMDTFFSDSSSVCTDVSYSSHGTDLSGQPDSGNFDESFYSIDNRSVNDEKEGTFEASLTPKDFMNLTDIHKNSQLRNCRSNSLHSTSTAKEGDAEYSEEDEDAFEETITPYQNHQTHQHVWPGTNYNQTVTSSLPMTFSI